MVFETVGELLARTDFTWDFDQRKDSRYWLSTAQCARTVREKEHMELCICEDDGRCPLWKGRIPNVVRRRRAGELPEEALRRRRRAQCHFLSPVAAREARGAAEGLQRQRDRLDGERRPREVLLPRQKRQLRHVKNANSRITQRPWRMPGDAQEGTRRGPRHHTSYGSWLRFAYCLYLDPTPGGAKRTAKATHQAVKERL